MDLHPGNSLAVHQAGSKIWATAWAAMNCIKDHVEGPALLHWCRDDLRHAGSPQSIVWGSKSRAEVHTVTLAVKQWHGPNKWCPDSPPHCAGTHGHGCTSTAKAVVVCRAGKRCAYAETQQAQSSDLCPVQLVKAWRGSPQQHGATQGQMHPPQRLCQTRHSCRPQD